MTDIQLLREDRIARIRFNRPEKRNALSPQMLRELTEVCDVLVADEQARVVVVEGVGETFSAGADLPGFSAEFVSAPAETADLGRMAVEALAGLPQVTVAVIRGHCVGGALVLAAACDLRIASDDSHYWIPELEAGIPLGWGGMARLVWLVGESVAIDLVVTCRPFGAEEALRAGFLSRVVVADDLDEEAAQLVGTIAGRTRSALRVTKAQLQAIRRGTFDSRGDAQALLRVLADPEAGSMFRAYSGRLE